MSLKGFPHGQVWAACSCFHYVAPTKSKSSGNLGGARFPELHAQVALNFFNSLLH
jgi:hypothetical protein